jgi:hypothetical protein
MRAVSGPRITGKHGAGVARRDFVDDGSSARVTKVRRGTSTATEASSVWPAELRNARAQKTAVVAATCARTTPSVFKAHVRPDETIGLERLG